MKKLFQKIKNLKYFFIGLRATQVLLISSQFKRDIANFNNIFFSCYCLDFFQVGEYIYCYRFYSAFIRRIVLKKRVCSIIRFVLF